MIEVQFPYFHLSDGIISYILRILPDGFAGHVYFGKALGSLDLEALDYLCAFRSKSPATTTLAMDSEFSLADQMLEYPVYGTSGFQEPALEIWKEQSMVYLNLLYEGHLIHGGKEKSMPGPQSRPDPDAETLELQLLDETHNIRVSLFYTIYPNAGTVVLSAKITNGGAEEIVLERAASGVLNLKGGNWNWLTLAGSWARERQPEVHPLFTGGSVSESLYGSSSHQSNPFSALLSQDPHNDSAYGVNLIYSSNFQSRADVNEFGLVRLMEGIHPLTFSWTLSGGESFQTPEMLLMHSPAGLDGLSRISSRFLRDHVISPKFACAPRPVCLNSWEAVYFGLNEPVLLELARKAAECGMECFVVDDGWFGKRDQDNCSLGDWVTDRRKFPQGLGAFAGKIRDLGLQFGLWFEPEMVSEDSDLYRAHPDWAIRPPEGRISYGRRQLVLDFCNPAVVETIFEQMKAIIEETKLTYIKWDMNRDITEAWSAWLHEQNRSQGELYVRYIQGVYSLYEKLEEAFPEVLIEGCAGGGGRLDPGLLYYSPQIWVSDNTDAYDRLKIQYATSLAYPLSCLSNHISACPNHQTDRSFSMTFRQDVAFFGIFGYELNLVKDHSLDPQELRKQIAQYKQMEPAVLHGDLYHLASPFETNTPAVALAWQDTVWAGLYEILSDFKAEPAPSVLLPMLEEGNWEVNGVTVPASILQNYGLRLPVKNNGGNRQYAEWVGDYQSRLVCLKRK